MSTKNFTRLSLPPRSSELQIISFQKHRGGLMFDDNFLASFLQDFRAGLTKTRNQKVSIIFRVEKLHVLEVQN